MKKLKILNCFIIVTVLLISFSCTEESIQLSDNTENYNFQAIELDETPYYDPFGLPDDPKIQITTAYIEWAAHTTPIQKKNFRISYTNPQSMMILYEYEVCPSNPKFETWYVSVNCFTCSDDPVIRIKDKEEMDKSGYIKQCHK